MLKKCVFCILLLFPIILFAESKVIHVTPQTPEFRIVEPTNSTTGYAWSVAYDRALLTLKSEKYYVPNSKLIGAGGKTIWVFSATPQAFKKMPSQTMIRLLYARPWNPKDNPREMFIVVEFAAA